MKARFAHAITTALLAGAASGASALTLVASNFDTDAEGWQALNGARNFEWVAAGYIRASDFNGDELWFFSAPATYRSGLGLAYGGELSYALMTSAVRAPLQTPYADVQILGNNGVLLSYAGGFLPATTWSTFEVPLVADGHWKIGSVGGPAAGAADMQAVLADVRALRIRGDYYQGIETTALDAVVLSAVPEPAAGVLAAAGLGLLGAARRRLKA